MTESSFRTADTLDPTLIAHLKSWTGRTETLVDQAGAAPILALAATLDRDDGDRLASDPAAELPPLWHWLYFLPRPLAREIGEDGHARRGGFLPPVPLPRRMWAGGRLKWQVGNPLRVGQRIERHSRILSVEHKAGRSGELVFVTVGHEVHNERGLALAEEHDIVYRAAARPGDPAPAPVVAETGAAWQRDLLADPVLLFRYSALTFNGHRIHYDRRYVTGVEGYPGLIVHGPLIATLLVDLLGRHAPGRALATFDFRAVRPTFDIHCFSVNGQPSEDGRTVRLWGADHEGFLTMQATATLA
ncbi:MaoC family dehydratase N-terminal domain-containing protein [Xylophilus sp. GOD-11R]|uniref:FAS1-like dehydratase domain-containing protein n=1 Tax=Xylophilus sp. GOD-11R TaxID=3089814 RepID=UPI00298C4FC8|nr:MaoC family dehydratase N-terminal domain-containing protein [Xylophilus sp. GOD-11R]WPB58817.1 MaoC family dehydratase N-terminal domain-containing protein [Xylophilus sp. GOD-11R]